MALIKINDNPSPRELRQFAGIWFPVFWLAVAGLLYLGAEGPRLAAAAATFGLMIGAIGLSRPSFIHPIYLAWMYAAYPIGFVVSHLLLGTIFYAVVTLIGLLMKVVGYDPLQRRLRSGEPSYWTRCARVTDKTQYFRQF